MLKGIDPILGPDLLAMLRAMGHGDEIVVVDANFPAATNARRLVRMDGLPAARVVKAIVALMPLDDFVPNAAFRMAVTGAPDSIPAVCEEFASILRAAGYRGQVEPIERMAFYDRAQLAYGIVATGEPRPWGNLILKKGTIVPAAE
jgi:L-fucose mutarotase